MPENSIAKLHLLLDVLAPVYAPIKLMFGLGLLTHGRALSHMILFTTAFKISGWPVLRGAFGRIQATRAAYMSNASTQTRPLQAVLASLQPEQVVEVIAGLHYGLVACIAAVVSPAVGGAGVGVAVGQTLDGHVQTLLRRYLATEPRLLALKSHHLRHWLRALAAHASEVAGVGAALAAGVPMSVLAGCLIGGQAVVEVSLESLHRHLQRLARRSPHPLLRRAATNFDPARAASGGLTYAAAAAGFLSQMTRAPGLSLIGRALLWAPLLAERALRGATSALLTKLRP